MTSLNSAFVALFLILTNATLPRGESPDNTMVKALMEEGLNHDQAVRVQLLYRVARRGHPGTR